MEELILLLSKIRHKKNIPLIDLREIDSGPFIKPPPREENSAPYVNRHVYTKVTNKPITHRSTVRIDQREIVKVRDRSDPDVSFYADKKYIEEVNSKLPYPQFEEVPSFCDRPHPQNHHLASTWGDHLG